MRSLKKNLPSPVSGEAVIAGNLHQVSPITITLLALSMVLAVTMAYHNSFEGQFLFDDTKHILENPRVRSITPLANTLSGRRPVVDLSLAINRYYATDDHGKPDSWGFHFLNLCVHGLAGLTLFGIVRRTIASWSQSDHLKEQAVWLAWAIALIWTVHPLQTQSVTYLIQRAESMMGLFYLLTLYTCIRSNHASTRARSAFWGSVAVGCCALSMGCKGVAVTLPIMILLYDWTFREVSFGEVLSRRWRLYTGLACGWLVLLATGLMQGVFSTDVAVATVGFGYKGSTWWQYLFTQPAALLQYLYLSIWPQSFCLDYGWEPVAHFRDAAGPGLIILSLLIITLVGLIKRRLYGFVGGWFFLILAPTSTIIPMKDPIFEHRMYLPLAAVITGLVALGYVAIKQFTPMKNMNAERVTRIVGVVLLLLFGILCIGRTVRRNEDYQSQLVMWRDVVNKRPDHARARLGFGSALFELGRYTQAADEFTEALRLKPSYADAHYNLGNAHIELGHWEAALKQYKLSIRINPSDARYHYNLANALKKLNRLENAIRGYLETVRLNPQHRSAYINLGNTLKLLGRLDEAIVSYQQALDLSPTYANTHYQMGDTYIRLGDLSRGLEALDLALKYHPQHQPARQLREKVQALIDR